MIHAMSHAISQNVSNYKDAKEKQKQEENYPGKDGAGTY